MTREEALEKIMIAYDRNSANRLLRALEALGLFKFDDPNKGEKIIIGDYSFFLHVVVKALNAQGCTVYRNRLEL